MLQPYRWGAVSRPCDGLSSLSNPPFSEPLFGLPLPHNLHILNSSLSLPLALIHFGRCPRPAHVSPLGPRYLGCSFVPGLTPGVFFSDCSVIISPAVLLQIGQNQVMESLDTNSESEHGQCVITQQTPILGLVFVILCSSMSLLLNRLMALAVRSPHPKVAAGLTTT